MVEDFDFEAMKAKAHARDARLRELAVVEARIRTEHNRSVSSKEPQRLSEAELRAEAAQHNIPFEITYFCRNHQTTEVAKFIGMANTEGNPVPHYNTPTSFTIGIDTAKRLAEGDVSTWEQYLTDSGSQL